MYCFEATGQDIDMKKLRLLAVLLAFVAFAATPGFSSTISYEQALQITGNQTWFGALGMNFQVLQSITVTQIGVFSNNAFGHEIASPGTNLNAAIFSLPSGFSDTTGTILSETEVSFNVDATYSVSQNWIFQSITPVVLLPGYYTIVAQGYNASDPNGNLGVSALPASTENGGGGMVLFGGGSRYENPVPGSLPNPVDFPATLDGGPSNRYYAGNFQYDGTVPEPVSMLLIGTGLVGFALLRSRRNR